MRAKSNRGSVAIFVFIAILFMVVILVLMIATANNKAEIMDIHNKELNTIYTSRNNDINVLYNAINTKDDTDLTDISWLSGTEKTKLKEEKISAKEKTVANTNIKGYITQVIENKTYEVPIPNDFYYVGGTIENGLVISDDSNDAGRGTINEDNLVGNQFVWIPTELVNYISTGNSNMETLISNYKGFFVGRYITKLNASNKIVIKKAGTTCTTLTQQTAEEMYTQYNNSYICNEALWNMTVNFINRKVSDWTINPKNNIYTTQTTAESEPYSLRIVLMVKATV